MGPLGKLHNIIIHIRSSANYIKQFIDLAGRRIPLNNYTRWNSWFRMLNVALKKETNINKYVKANFDSLKQDYLTPQD